MTVDVRGIVDRCIKTGNNPRIMNMEDLCSEGNYQYKLLMTSESVIDEGIFVSPTKQGLYIDGIFDLGLKLTKYNGVECSLYRLTRDVPSKLCVCKFNGKSEEITDSTVECTKDCKRHLDNLSELQFGEDKTTDITNYFEVSSPYGECIPVDNYYIETGFEFLDLPMVETDQTYRTSTFKFKKNQFNKPINKPQGQQSPNVVKRKGGSRRGEVWWVKKLEYGESGTANHGFKDRPVIITEIIRGIAHYYMCTSNNKQYFFPKYRLKEPIEDGLSKEPVYVELRERELPETKLDNLVGYLTNTDMDVIFNPIKSSLTRVLY